MSETTENARRRAEAAFEAYRAAHEDYGTEDLYEFEAAIMDLIADVCHLIDQKGSAAPGALLSYALRTYYAVELSEHLKSELDGEGVDIEIGALARDVARQTREIYEAHGQPYASVEGLVYDAALLSARVMNLIRK